MSSLTVTLILFSLLLLLLFLNVPLVVSIGLPTALIMLGSGMKVATLAQRTYASVDSFTLMAIPFFMLAGKLMEVGGMSKRIVRLADCLDGRRSGPCNRGSLCIFRRTVRLCRSDHSSYRFHIDSRDEEARISCGFCSWYPGGCRRFGCYYPAQYYHDYVRCLLIHVHR